MSYETPIEYQIAIILQDNGLGTFATDIFCAKEPDAPDDCITIYNTGGIPDDCLDRDSRGAESPNFQVRVRNNDYLAGYAVMESIREVLNKKSNTITDSVDVTTIESWMITLPNSIMRDTTNRPVITANFSCLRDVVVLD